METSTVATCLFLLLWSFSRPIPHHRDPGSPPGCLLKKIVSVMYGSLFKMPPPLPIWCFPCLIFFKELFELTNSFLNIIRFKRSTPGSVLRIRIRDPRSGIRDPVPFWPLDPGSEIGFFRIPDLGSRIPNPYFWELNDNILSKKFNNSLKIDPNFFVQHFKHKIIYNFVKFMAIKKGMTTIFFPPLSFVAVFGSGIRDPGWVKIRIRDAG